MYIQTEQTPNPSTLKFVPGRDVRPEGVLEFQDSEAAARTSPLASRLFGVDGVHSVYLGTDFISVTKSEMTDWYMIKPQVLSAIMDHFMSDEPVVYEDAAILDDVKLDESDETVMQIKKLIDERVRPAVAMDGGDIVFYGFDRGIVYLHMRGACAGCPSSTITLKNGIENLLKYYVPEVVEVRPVN